VAYTVTNTLGNIFRGEAQWQFNLIETWTQNIFYNWSTT